ncbi:MAG: pyruvate formate lyase family protein, partial [Coriobacteriales bacterium]
INDVESGKITVKEAGQMLGELIGRWGTALHIMAESLKESHQVNYGINALALGGYNQNHEDASNELSALFLKMVGLLKISSPTVTVRWNPKTPDWMMQRAIECNMEIRGGIPLFQNDDRTIQQYLDCGIPWSEACEWFGLGCVYPALLTRAEHYGMEGLAGLNLAAMLDMALHNGKDINGVQLGPDMGDATDFKNIDEIMDAMFAEHKYIIDRTVEAAHIAVDVEGRYMREPFWSTIAVPWHFANGQDILFPDPDYSLWGFSDRAIIDCADTLEAIKVLVFDEKKLTMAELMEAIDSNFEGERGEEIRQMCLAAPKFGNDIDEVDYLVSKISDRSAAYIKNVDNSPFRHFMITREGLSWHFSAGLGVRALADGRKAKEPLDDGSFSPMGGADKNGPTAVLRSVLKAQQKDAAASVLNQKFTKTLLSTPGSRDMLAKYTSAFLGAGGSHIQYNIMDTEELVEAQEKPAEHEDLIVRIGGFSAYFVQLSEGIQDDVIQRTEQAL